MVVGQNAKPARSKTRKLSKSEEKDIRAAADMRAKAKPLEYAAFDASSRFGEGLSFLDDTHVPTLKEFKKKQSTKPDPASNAEEDAKRSAVPAATAAKGPSQASASNPAPTAPPAKVAQSVVDSLQLTTGRTVSEDFLTSGAVGVNPKQKGGRGGRRSKSTSVVDNDDDDDFIPKKGKKKMVGKKSAVSKKKTTTAPAIKDKEKEEKEIFSPVADAVIVQPKGKKQKKKSSSQFFSCEEGESENKTANKVASSSKKDDASNERNSTNADNAAGRRRGRGVPKSYVEPSVNSKMRR